MLIGALGHGTYSVMMRDTHFLIDPMLTPTFLRGASEPFPRRKINLDRLPPVDALLITHSHPGHLEPESLALLPREVPVFAPADETIELVLAKMGFLHREAVRSGQRLTIGDGSVRFIGGDGYVSAVFDDEDGRFWYLGDRGDFFSAGVVESVVAERSVDVALVSHPSDYHSYLQHTTWDGGAQEGESHADWLARSLQTAVSIGAALTIPGSTSNRYLGSAAWLNKFVFPMRPAEFADQLTRLAQSLSAAVLNPGDAALVTAGKVRVECGALPYVTGLEQRDDRGLDPTVSVPEVVDPNPEGIARDELMRRCDDYLRQTLAAWAGQRSGPCMDQLSKMHHLGLSYRVVAVFDDGPAAAWRMVLRDWNVDVSRVDADDAANYGELVLRIPASTLDRWSRNVIPYFEAGLDCRRAGQAYAVGLRFDGTVSAAPARFRDLVTLHLTSSTVAYHQWLLRTYWPDDV